MIQIIQIGDTIISIPSSILDIITTIGIGYIGVIFVISVIFAIITAKFFWYKQESKNGI